MASALTDPASPSYWSMTTIYQRNWKSQTMLMLSTYILQKHLIKSTTAYITEQLLKSTTAYITEQDFD